MRETASAETTTAERAWSTDAARDPEDWAQRLDERLRLLPLQSGVYLFRDSRRRVIYVGKARAAPSARAELLPRIRLPDDPRLRGLRRRIRLLDWIVTATEVEALILEDSLIKQYAPRYNIRLKDDKRYPYLRITAGPRLSGDGPDAAGGARRGALLRAVHPGEGPATRRADPARRLSPAQLHRPAPGPRRAGVPPVLHPSVHRALHCAGRRRADYARTGAAARSTCSPGSGEEVLGVLDGSGCAQPRRSFASRRARGCGTRSRCCASSCRSRG